MSKDSKSKPLESDSSGDEQDETSNPDFYYNKSKMPAYKVILLGDVGSGKTSLFSRYKFGSFRKAATLQGTDRFKKDFVNDQGEKVQMILWDTAGMERMGSLTFHYYHGAHAVILVFALDDSSTFDALGTWNEDASRYSPSEIKRFLVATKSDVEKHEVDVSKERINSFCRNKNISEIYYTSAKTGEGVEEMFQSVMKSLSNTMEQSNGGENDVWGIAFQANLNKMKKKKGSRCAC